MRHGLFEMTMATPVIYAFAQLKIQRSECIYAEARANFYQCTRRQPITGWTARSSASGKRISCSGLN